MVYLDLAAVAATRLHRDPFEHLLLDHALFSESATAITCDFPGIHKPGSFALADVKAGPAVRQLIAELDSHAFRELMAEKFDVDLVGKPTVFTLRGVCAARDGRIHTDSRAKILSVLIYLNLSWAPEGGRLRLLRNGRDIDAFTTEIEPTFGKMVAFLRTDRSWHGHRPCQGERRVLQMSYVGSAKTSLISDLRHRVSALMK